MAGLGGKFILFSVVRYGSKMLVRLAGGIGCLREIETTNQFTALHILMLATSNAVELRCARSAIAGVVAGASSTGAAGRTAAEMRLMAEARKVAVKSFMLRS